MQEEPFSITLTYPDGTGLTMTGRGLIASVASEEGARLTAITGRLTTGDLAQLMTELLDSFGTEETCLAMSLALISRRIREEE